MTLFLLDTNICVELLRGRVPALLERISEFESGQIILSSITLAELHFGLARSGRRAEQENLLAEFCAPLTLLPFDDLAAQAYGEVRAALERAGTPIGPLDTLLAAQAMSRDLTLVTNNQREFRRVAGLRVENWLRR